MMDTSDTQLNSVTTPITRKEVMGEGVGLLRRLFSYQIAPKFYFTH